MEPMEVPAGFEFLQSLAYQYGYLGVFLVSLIGSTIPFLPLPYLFVVVLLSNVLNPVYLAIASGIGGALGKLTSYALGRFGYRLFSSGTQRRLDSLKRALGKYGAIGVFIFALTPLPDDVYMIPMGMVKMKFVHFLLATLVGKVLLSLFVAYAGPYYLVAVEVLIGGSSFVGTAVAIGGLVVITVLLLRVDWELLVKVAEEDGIRGIIANLPRILSISKSK